MGKIVEKIKITNVFEPEKEIELEVVIDAGATMPVLPQNVIDGLNLRKMREVKVRYANNRTEIKSIYGIVTVEMCGRAGEFNVLAEPKGAQPLVGQIVLEQLDLIVDPSTRRVTPNPRSPEMPMVEILMATSPNSGHNDLKTKDVLKVILEIARSIKYNGLLNERYLHHFFSYLLQEKYNLLNLTGDNRGITLHPEWPTYKAQAGLTFGRYRKVNGIYKPDANGTAGFIDFAIGDYNKPDIGIEFSLKYGWSNEEIVFDFIKLLDKKNPFNASISFNVIFREGKLVEGGHLRDLERHMNDAFREAVNRLEDEVCDNSREIYFIVTEIDKNNNRRHWHYDRTSSRFEDDLPVIA